MLRRGWKQLASVPLRSGAHPDFKFAGTYEHKRIVSIYDGCMWFYDGVRPEFIVDIMQPQLTGGVLWTRNVVLAFGVPMTLAILLTTILGKFFTQPFQDLYAADNEEFTNPLRALMKEGMDKKVYARKHPLGHMHDYQSEGWMATPQHWLYKQFKLV